MRLRVSQVIVKGTGKHVLDKEGALRHDEDGTPILKYNIVGYEIEDLDGGIATTKVLREEAGKYVFNLLNADVQKDIANKKAAGEAITDEDNDRYVFDIENATVNMRMNTKKDGSEDITVYLKARAGVIRSLEIPELVVDFLDANGNTKIGYELFDELKPKKSASKTKTKNSSSKKSTKTSSSKQSKDDEAENALITKDSMKRFAEAVKDRNIDILSALEPKQPRVTEEQDQE